VGKEAQPEQLQTERHLHQASVWEGQENTSVFSTLDPPKRHNNTTISIAYADCYHATGLSCPISQTWTPHCQDNLSMVGATMSSSTARTEKGQEYDQLTPYPHRRASVSSRLRPWVRQQDGEEEQDEGQEDERDIRRRWKWWCAYDVKRPRGHAIATARVGVGDGVRRIQGEGA
jgi:hypothetical protein